MSAVEQGPDLFPHEFDQRADVELARHLLRHGVDRVELGRALLGRGEQPGVLERDRRLTGEADQELQIVAVERRPRDPPHREHALDVVADEQWRHHQPLERRGRGAFDLNAAIIRSGVVHEVGDPAVDDVADDPLAVDGSRSR